MDHASPIIEIDRKALAELISRVEEAIEHNLALSVDDLKLLLLAISTLCTLQEKIEADDVTLHKLRKLLGMVQQSERHSRELDDEKKGKKNTHQKNSIKKPKKRKSPARAPKLIYHAITEYQREVRPRSWSKDIKSLAFSNLIPLAQQQWLLLAVKNVLQLG